MSLTFESETTPENRRMHLSLRGELDYASARELEARLRDLRESETPVRLDLSGLQFMDSSGLRVLFRAVAHARESGWDFEIDRDVPQLLESRFKLSGLANMLGW